MKYMLLIHHGDAATPDDAEAWERLSEDERNAVAADYQAIDQTPGVTPGLWMQGPEAATTVRVQDGRTLTTDGPFAAVKEALGGYLVFEAATWTSRRRSPTSGSSCCSRAAIRRSRSTHRSR
jgi:hypothetical protein